MVLSFATTFYPIDLEGTQRSGMSGFGCITDGEWIYRIDLSPSALQHGRRKVQLHLVIPQTIVRRFDERSEVCS